MAKKYHSFQDLPLEISEILKKRIIEGEKRQYPDIPKDASMEEIIRARQESFRNPDYTEEQLAHVVDAFTLVNTAVRRGLPNELYQMFVKALDSELALRAHAANAIWYAHEGDDLAKRAVQAFATMVKREVDKRATWDEEQFHREYFLNRE